MPPIIYRLANGFDNSRPCRVKSVGFSLVRHRQCNINLSCCQLETTKPGSTHHYKIVFLKISCTKSGKWQLFYNSSFLCALHFIVVFLLCHDSLLIFDAFPSVLVCNRDLFFFSLNRFISFEQRYTTVAFI